MGAPLKAWSHGAGSNGVSRTPRPYTSCIAFHVSCTRGCCGCSRSRSREYPELSRRLKNHRCASSEEHVVEDLVRWPGAGVLEMEGRSGLVNRIGPLTA